MENLEKDDLLFLTVFKSKNDQDIYLLFPKIFFKDYNKKDTILQFFIGLMDYLTMGSFLDK